MTPELLRLHSVLWLFYPFVLFTQSFTASCQYLQLCQYQDNGTVYYTTWHGMAYVGIAVPLML